MDGLKENSTVRGGGACRLPELTGLQYLVVAILFDGEMTSSELREELARRGNPRGQASFSQLMRRMLRTSIVTYTPRGIESTDGTRPGYLTRQHCYRVSNLGVHLWTVARDYYLSFEPPGDELEAAEVLGAEFAEHGPKERKEMEKEMFRDALTKLLELECGRL